jgi:hypothetical protein
MSQATVRAQAVQLVVSEVAVPEPIAGLDLVPTYPTALSLTAKWRELRGRPRRCQIYHNSIKIPVDYGTFFCKKTGKSAKTIVVDSGAERVGFAWL